MVAQTVLNPDGSLASGTALIRITAACQSGTDYVDMNTVSTRFSNGAFSVTLVPNDTCVPAGTSYVVTWTLAGGRTWNETWLVPTSSSPVTVSSVIQATAIPIPVQIQPNQIGPGGASAGQFLGFNGAWGPQTLPRSISMAAQLGDFAASLSSATDLNVGGSCAIATPCSVRFGNVGYFFTSGFDVNLAHGTGTAYVYIGPNGAFTVGYTLAPDASGTTGLTCTGTCVAISGVSAFPANAIPLWEWSATSGTWDTTGGRDFRSFIGTTNVTTGAMLASITGNGITTISLDPTTSTNPLSSLWVGATAPLIGSPGAPVCLDGGGGLSPTCSPGSWITSLSWSDLTGVPPSFAPSAHAAMHASGGSDPVTIAESQVNNLVTDLAAKQPALGFTPENTAKKDAASGYAGLDAGGKLKTTEFPSSYPGVASFANALANTPTACGAGQAAQGVDTHGNAQGCQSVSGGSGGGALTTWDSDFGFCGGGSPTSTGTNLSFNGSFSAQCNSITAAGGNGWNLLERSNSNSDQLVFHLGVPSGAATLTVYLQGFGASSGSMTWTLYTGCVANGAIFNSGNQSSGTAATVTTSNNTRTDLQFNAVALSACPTGSLLFVELARSGPYSDVFFMQHIHAEIH